MSHKQKQNGNKNSGQPEFDFAAVRVLQTKQPVSGDTKQGKMCEMILCETISHKIISHKSVIEFPYCNLFLELITGLFNLM
jgi:hypothetical protein